MKIIVLWILIVVYFIICFPERKPFVVNKLALFVTILTHLVFEYLIVSYVMTETNDSYFSYKKKVRCENYLPLDSSFYTPEVLVE